MKRIIVLSLLISFALGMSARTFTAGDVIYVKLNPSKWSWYGDNPDDGKFAYFFNSSGYAWSEEAIGVDWCSDVLQIKVPAGNWTHVILTRNSVHSNPKWSNVYNNGDDSKVNKTADIEIPDNQNYLDNFRQFKDKDAHGDDMWHWSDCYFYRPSADPTSSSVTKIGNANREVIKVCTQSVGDPFSLQPPLKSPTEGYDYDQGRTWFKWVGGKWVELHYANSHWGFDGTSGLNETIGAADSHTYYFLSTSDQSKQRFIEVAVTRDCSPSCEITDFGVVTSSVNAHDSTYVLDGIVAFKDANGKTLRISVTDAKGKHYVDYVNPSTPHIFSLPGLFADGTKNLKATAQFLNTSYSRQSNSYDAPNAIESINTKVIDLTHGEGTTLVPDYPGSDGYKWSDGNTTNHERTIPAYNFDTTIIYIYYEYEKAPEVAGNLIKNGDFSTDGFDYGTINRDADVTKSPFSTISDYHFWGKDVTSSSNFYTTYGNITGGMAIVTDANKFWKRYTKKIETKEGNHFALFDADNSGEKAAWKIETSATHPNLKLAKGTNYMFSFWVANINNYGEMNNAAKLQFEISYSTDGGSSWSTAEKLGNPIDLNYYLDNLWHQNSFVYVAKEDANKVRISVKDLNTNANPGGNDFALDDIKFQAISVVSQAIKHCQRFVVNIYEAPCVFSSIKIDTIRPKCSDADHSKYSLRVTLKYDKPQGVLTLTDNIYGKIYEEAIVSEATSKVITIDNLAADGKEHTITAKFTKPDGHGVDKGCEIVGNFVAPGTPAFSVDAPTVPDANCDVTTFDLDVTTTFAYQNGTQLLYYWDDALHSEATKTITYGASTSITSTLKNLPYDGNAHTLVVKTNNGTHDCEASVAIPAIPYMPSVTVNEPEVLPYACDNPTYSVKVSASFTNSQLHDIIFKDWKNGEQRVSVTTNDGTAEYTFTYDWDDAPTLHEYDVYFDGATTCAHKKSYTSPAEPKVTVTQHVPDITCDQTTYDLDVEIKYTNQNGTLAVDVDGVAADPATIAFTPDSPNELTLTASIKNLPADGAENHVLNVVFSGNAHNCPVDPIVFTAPFSPVINSVTIQTVDPNTVLCNENDYHRNVTLLIPYDTIGANIILTYEGRDTLIATTGQSTTVDVRLTTIGGSTETISAAFETSPTCIKTSDPFVTPIRLSCEKLDTTLCEGQTLVWKDDTYPQVPYIGTDTFTIGYDSLILTIKAIPEITVGAIDMACDDANEVRIPFAIKNGNPDSIDVVVNGDHFAGTIDGTDIIFSLPTMEAGDYSATLNVGEAGNTKCGTTENITFTIALSGQMYSKWTDVLFINNKDNIYTHYQWFADGVEMSGENLQRLYNPNGLSGTTIKYHCRLTTTDNKTYYTCPQTFDEVTPSRTVNTDGTTQVIGIYDTMGRLIQGTPHNGIYIIFEKLENGSTRARKIAIYE